MWWFWKCGGLAPACGCLCGLIFEQEEFPMFSVRCIRDQLVGVESLSSQRQTGGFPITPGRTGGCCVCYIRDPTNGFPVCHIGEDCLDVTSVTSSGTKWWTSCPCITVQADLSSLSHELFRPCFGRLLGSLRKFGPDTEVTPPSGASSRVHGF